jgi:PAS domain S-box-containing protein
MVTAAHGHRSGGGPGEPGTPEQALRLLESDIRDYAVFTLDPSGRVSSWNEGAERIMGYTTGEIAGEHFSVFHQAEDVAAGRPERELQAAAAVGRIEEEGWRVRKDGTRFWADVVTTALFDESGGLHGYAKVTRDLSERRATDQRLRETEEHFRLLVQSVTDYAIFMLDPQGRIASWNAGAERIKGYRAEEITGVHFSVFYPPEDVASGKPQRELEIAVAEGRVEDEGWRVRKDGTRFWANVVITALFGDSGELRGFGKVTRDMTERREREQIMHDRRRLLAYLVQAQERERRRIAWDVHDDSIQSMVAVGMRQQLLADQLPEQYADQLSRLNEAVDAAIGRLRGLVFRLRPSGIERDGLAKALSGYLAEAADGWGLEHRFDFGLDREPPSECAVTVFRVCQEALANVHKHARASTVSISLAPDRDGVFTRVCDDGVGVDESVDMRPDPDHYGVIEMRERAEAAGGWWTMHRRAEGGTAVEFWIPAGAAEPLEIREDRPRPETVR